MKIKFWNDGWTPGGTITVPSNYEFLKAGDGPLTAAVCRAMGKYPIYVKMVKRRGYSKPVGIYAEPGLIAAETLRLAYRKSPETAAIRKIQRQAKQAREISRFAAKIKTDFPSCPESEVLEIAEHACETGSGRVGRSRTAEDAVFLAVQAHIRHNHTNYDELLFDSDREYARDAVRDEIESKIAEWQK